ncbi:hypothetical protein ETAA8_24090 [Anatilimnocola aggregata]|uniref:Thioredoxin domain-containing protein n=1 Tax=Anatilimnocola aggregata TaxID=2528021 RepID=A0A517YAZ0_9BACT|nr:hypothetical protein [Anatilimnocola aggregata]QDU27322.1 hypothetical protein ETAA8_24090 [Anatilimnocola aggregata]
MSLSNRAALLLIVAAAVAIPSASAQPAASKAQAAMSQAAQQGKYTFVLFYKQNDPATSTMNTTLQQSLAKYANVAVLTFVQVADPSEQALVAKYDVARAPMPMCVAIAPNGAMTGIFAQQLQAQHVANAIVTPTMMQVMRALQDNKLAFVTVHGSGNPVVPASLREFQSDPHFSARMVSLSMNAADPAEARFVAEMEVDPRTPGTHLSLLAPPGVLVGKFAANTPKATIAAALAEAGKCCDDPNCKHHQQPGQQQPTQGNNQAATQRAPAR